MRKLSLYCLVCAGLCLASIGTRGGAWAEEAPGTASRTINGSVRNQDLRPVPQAIVFDMQSILSASQPTEYGLMPRGSAWRHDPYLSDGDIIYVPPTALASANDWIDQVFTRGIRAVLPYSGNVGMNFGYEIYQAPTTVKTTYNGPSRYDGWFGPWRQ